MTRYSGMLTGREHAHLDDCERLVRKHRPISIEDAAELCRICRKLIEQNKGLRRTVAVLDGVGGRKEAR